MKSLFLWRIPQASLFILGAGWGMTQLPEGSGGTGAAIFGAMLAAAYTGGVNLVIDLLAYWKRRRARRQQSLS